ncbi:uncharacterized protein LOC108917857 [Anoplophora glabripennis]|uniref:uncharacterized protein LOC108917857 n=1 Tax=Anoplophora glabripennis TaxID=217634 RepID=UPI000C786EF2|nr:uncharacterized protein LOC108917857 [Anoplophora glabripennis]
MNLNILAERTTLSKTCGCVQALDDGDAPQRLEFRRWLLEQHVQNDRFISLIVWSDETCFTRDGINNNHNEHIWALQNPHAVRSRRFQQKYYLSRFVIEFVEHPVHL